MCDQLAETLLNAGNVWKENKTENTELVQFACVKTAYVVCDTALFEVLLSNFPQFGAVMLLQHTAALRSNSQLKKKNKQFYYWSGVKDENTALKCFF